jgi:hypothetical protein
MEKKKKGKLKKCVFYVFRLPNILLRKIKPRSYWEKFIHIPALKKKILRTSYSMSK